MPTFDQSSAAVLVFTFKEGALAAAAHDLKISVGRFRIDVADDGSRVDATFDAASLEVVCARRDGADAPHALPRVFFGEVEKNIAKDVLHPRRFPEVKFSSTSVSDTEVVGTLTLHGVAREVRVARTGMQGRVLIDQRDFGIKPFSAMMGTLKVKAAIEVEVQLGVAPLP